MKSPREEREGSEGKEKGRREGGTNRRAGPNGEKRQIRQRGRREKEKEVKEDDEGTNKKKTEKERERERWYAKETYVPTRTPQDASYHARASGPPMPRS